MKALLAAVVAGIMSVFGAHDITAKNAPPATPATSAIPSKGSATSFQNVKSAESIPPTAPSGAMAAAAAAVLSEPSALSSSLSPADQQNRAATPETSAPSQYVSKADLDAVIDERLNERLAPLAALVPALRQLVTHFPTTQPTTNTVYVPTFSPSGPSAPITVAAWAASQRIDNLSGTTISNPTITGGSITASSITGTITSAIDSALAAIESLTATDLVAVNATTTNFIATNATTTSLFVKSSISSPLASFGTLTATSTLAVPSIPSSLLATDGSGTVVATSSPTAAYFTATSTATSTFAGGIAAVRFNASATSTLAGLKVTTLDCSSYGNGGKLTTDVFGNVYCSDDYGSSGGGGTPGGANTQVQFNDSGSLNGDSGFTYNKTTDLATLTNASTTNITASYASSTQGFFGVLTLPTLSSGALAVDANGIVYKGATSTLSTISGTLALSQIANIGANTILGNATGASGNVTAISTSSLGILTTNVAEGSNLYFTGARADARINATSSIGTLTALPNLGTVATSLTGFLKATAGVLSTALVNLASDVTGTLAVSHGGTGWANVASGAIPYGNGSSALATTTAGTNGQVLAYLNGVPAWTATTTFSGPLAYTNGTVSIPAANGSTDGFLTSGDWTTFNGKLASVTADAPLSGSGTSGSHLTLDTSGTWSGNAGTATKLATARTINSVSFDGTANITISAASSTALADYNTWTNAQTLSAAPIFSSLSGLLKGNGASAVTAAQAGVDYVSLANLAAAFPFTPASWGNSTSTTIGFGNGIISNASSTFASSIYLTSLTSGGLGVDANGKVYKAATTTFSTGLSYGNGNVTCDTANGSIFGCLSATDWITFNGKQAALVSGTNIKTVNGTTLLGSGDLGTIDITYGGTNATSFTSGQPIAYDGTRFVSTSSIPATMIDYIAPGTGAISRTLASRNGEVINLADYGAVGDCSTNDTTAVQNAINAAAGKILYVPPVSNCYLVQGGQITINSSNAPYEIYGAGSRIPNISTQGGSTFRVSTASGDVFHIQDLDRAIVIRDIGIGSTYSGRTSGSGIRISHVSSDNSDTLIDNVFITDQPIGIWAENVSGITIQGGAIGLNYVTVAEPIGILFENDNHVDGGGGKVRGTQITGGTGSTGIKYLSGGGLFIDQVNFLGGKVGFWLSSVSGIPFQSGQLLINHSSFDSISDTAILLQGVNTTDAFYKINITNNTFFTAGHRQVYVNGLNTGNYRGVQISGNSFQTTGSQTDPVVEIALSNSVNLASNNFVNENATGGTAVYFNGCTSCFEWANVFAGWATNVSGQPNYGFGTGSPKGLLSAQLGSASGGGNIGGAWDNTYAVFGDAGNANGAAVGIGYDTSGNAGNILSVAPGAGWKDLKLRAANHIFYVSGVEALRITSTGNVGIGTTTPWGLLSINPDVGIGSNPAFAIGSSSATYFMVKNNGNVGIGNTAPAHPLDIGDGTAASDVYVYGNVSGSKNSYVRMSDRAGIFIGFNAVVGGVEKTRINGDGTSFFNSGNVGIATTSPWRTLSVTGTVGFDGLTPGAGAGALCLSANKEVTYSNGAGCTGSSQRFKHDIAPLDASTSLDEVLRLNPVSFVYNDDIGVAGPQVGLIAEQVQQVEPRLVATDASGTPFTVKYENLTAILAAAIQQLAHKLDDLANTVASFAERVVTKELVAVNVTANTGTFNTLCVKKSDATPVCVTGDQLAALLSQSAAAGFANPSPAPTNTQFANPTPDPAEPPIIEIQGNNPAHIHIGDVYNDLGATITGPATDLNLGIKTFLNGALVSNIVLDTTAAATHTVDYVVTDQNGLTSTSTRTVIVEAPSQPTSPPGAATSSQTDATTAAQ